MNNFLGQVSKRSIPVLLFLYIAGANAQAGGIQGIGGYTLGEALDEKLVLKETKTSDGVTLYRVKPIAASPQVDLITLRITRKRQIHRISADSPVLTETDCQTRMSRLRVQTEKQSPELGYYAMADGELFYQDDRTYTLDCVKTDSGIRLRQEYSDDKLAAQ